MPQARPNSGGSQAPARSKQVALLQAEFGGEGKAPTRLFVAGKERYERGEQEVNTKVRVLRGSEVLAAFSVRNWSGGDEPPFKIDSLVAENWTTVFAVLAGRQVEMHSSAGAR